MPSTARPRLLLALIAVYLIWGSTYLGVRIALAGFPPLLLVGPRYVLAGAILFAWLRARGAPAPSAREWRGSAIVGALLACGSASTAYAIAEVSTGVTAVACASVPLWSTLFARAHGQRATSREWAGLFVGLVGIAVLNARSELAAHVGAAAVLWIGSIGWSYGSVLSARATQPPGAMASAAQMLVGGAIVTVLALARGERVTGAPPARAWIALAYLVVVGSIVAYSAYVYLLAHARPSVATSYAYVNPIVAVALGVAFEGEALGRATIAACALVLGGVGLLALGREPTRVEEAIARASLVPRPQR